MNIKPLGNKAVILLSKTETSKSGIVISTSQETEESMGKIIAIGGGFDCVDGNISDLGLKIGDIVLLNKYGGEGVKDPENNEIEYSVVAGKDILAVIEK